jgi:hypothetical protein
MRVLIDTCVAVHLLVRDNKSLRYNRRGLNFELSQARAVEVSKVVADEQWCLSVQVVTELAKLLTAAGNTKAAVAEGLTSWYEVCRVSGGVADTVSEDDATISLALRDLAGHMAHEGKPDEKNVRAALRMNAAIATIDRRLAGYCEMRGITAFTYAPVTQLATV